MRFDAMRCDANHKSFVITNQRGRPFVILSNTPFPCLLFGEGSPHKPSLFDPVSIWSQGGGLFWSFYVMFFSCLYINLLYTCFGRIRSSSRSQQEKKWSEGKTDDEQCSSIEQQGRERTR